MTTFLLIRHGAHDWLGRTLVGRAPGISINAPGQAQAIALVERLAAWRSGLSAIYSSPLARCRETAAPLAQAIGRPIVPAAALNEIDYGTWTQRSFAELALDPAWRDWNENRATARVPNGESMAEVQARMVGQLTTWAEGLPGGETVAVFGHGDPLKAVIAQLLGWPLQSILEFEFPPGAYAVVYAQRGKLELLTEASEISLPLSAA